MGSPETSGFWWGIRAMRPLCGKKHGENRKSQRTEGDYAGFPDSGQSPNVPSLQRRDRRGRDDGMNLTRYFMVREPMDDKFGPADIPDVWNLAQYRDAEGRLPNYAGDTHDVHSVMIDSALGVLGAAPANKADFLAQVKWLQDYLSNLPPPKYPFPIDAARAAGAGACATGAGACATGAGAAGTESAASGCSAGPGSVPSPGTGSAGAAGTGAARAGAGTGSTGATGAGPCTTCSRGSTTTGASACPGPDRLGWNRFRPLVGPACWRAGTS